MSNLELVNKITAHYGNQSKIEAIRDMYQSYGFSDKQKKAIELFLFEPTPEQAYKAVEMTPKSWVFIKHAIKEKKIVEWVSDMILEGQVNKTYLRVIMNNGYLQELLEGLLQSPCKEIVEKYMKQYEMQKKLKD